MESKGSVLPLQTDTVLSHSYQSPSLTISFSSILNVAAFQDAASLSSVWHFARDIQYCMHFFYFQLSPFLIVNGLRLEIQIRLLAVVILVFSKIRLMTVISYCSV